MKKKGFLIAIGLCGVMALSGCTGAPVENTDIGAFDEVVVNIESLPAIELDGVEITDTVFPNKNESYILYQGVSKAEIEEYKEVLRKEGYEDWVNADPEAELVYEYALKENTQVALIYSQDESSKSLQVFMVEDVGLVLPSEDSETIDDQEGIDEDNQEDEESVEDVGDDN